VEEFSSRALIVKPAASIRSAVTALLASFLARKKTGHVCRKRVVIFYNCVLGLCFMLAALSDVRLLRPYRLFCWA
jgi:hypothetical protein